jgi:hypothetical protein
MKIYKVENVPATMATVVDKRGELYFPIEAFGLTVKDVMDIVVEIGGDILVGVNDGLSGVVVSEDAIGGALIEQGFVKAREFSETVKSIKEKIKEQNNGQGN